ncbi:MAG: hypothetical protein KJO26_11215 [Deltaproteobacteria bacterium]|nr:hypothetical protein [Deltaproteobacteria bacterium]
MKKESEQIEIENILHHLNYRWNIEVLAQWEGTRIPFKPHQIYDGYDIFISHDTFDRIDQLKDKPAGTRLKHALIDHYLQRSLLPHETEMRGWMQGAAAIVNGNKIYFRDIISWCQKASSYQSRQILQKETGPLCKFLKPFALNYWNILLDILQEEFGFTSYNHYCQMKKGIDYPHYHDYFKDFLLKTDDLYFTAMESWSQNQFGLPLKKLSRFDAIHILGLVQFDDFFPQNAMEKLIGFFNQWGIDLDNTPGLNLKLERDEKKSSQAMCFILQVPEEVYVLMQPEGGWVDMETLSHELGHGLSAVYTSPELSMMDREMTASYSLSESYAFLLQNMALSGPFLKKYLGMEAGIVNQLVHYKMLKDLAVFRRYAAKFISEFDMFSKGDLSDGDSYAKLMARYTGFYHQPESHLFDLVPEFYSLDYLFGWMGESILQRHLSQTLGSGWMLKPETGEVLKKWWWQGNRYDIFQFFEINGLGPLTADLLVDRWKENLT